MKAQFIVTIEGSWLEGDKRVTHAEMQRELRKVVQDGFQYLAKRTSVKKLPKAAPALPVVDRAAVLEEAAVICEDHHYKWRWDNEPDSDSGPRTCARAIRERAAEQAEVKP